MPSFELVQAIAQQLLYSIFLDVKFIFIYLVIFILIKKRLEVVSELDSNFTKNKKLWWKRNIEEVVIICLLSGFIGGIVSIYFGVSVTEKGLELIFYVTIILAIINKRFICFSYAGAIVCVYTYFFNPELVDISSILFIISLIHFIEAVLVKYENNSKAVPVFIMHKGQIAGAFVTQRYWVIPVMFLVIINQSSIRLSSPINVNWHTIFDYQSFLGYIPTMSVMLGVTGVLAFTGYWDISITMLPEKKAKGRAIHLLVYASIVLISSILSMNIDIFKLIGSFLAIVGHEFIIRYDLIKERNGKPLFLATQKGVRILDVLPASVAAKMKLQRGETILYINGKSVHTADGIRHALVNSPTFIWMYTEGIDGRQKIYEYKCYPEGVSELGVVLVPRESEVTYQLDSIDHFKILNDIVDRFKMKR